MPYSQGDQFKKSKLGREFGTHVVRSAYEVLVGKPEGKRQLGRLRRRWEDNIKMNLTEFSCEGVI
jgi:hypothetical protein